MNGVVSAAALLTDLMTTEEQKQLCSIILDSSDVLLRVINDILDYSKMESKDFVLANETFKIHEEVDKVIKRYNLIVKNKIKLEAVYTEIPAVIGDASRFQQVVGNLVDNAVKFTDKGKVSVVVDSIVLENFVDIKVRVIDTGIGIDNASYGKLFQPFSQLDFSSRKKFKGTGLGLSICKNLVELMKGEIGVIGVLNEGSTFWFSLRLQKANIDPIVVETPVQILSQSVQNPDIHILVAEDNVINQMVILKILKKLGYVKVTIAVNGVDVVQKFKDGVYSVILMDIQMPIMDGYEATKLIREIHKTVPIIAMTANALKQDVEKCKEVGMNDYISKPVDFVLLFKLLNEI
jgi:CheY-like chemotaxis protein/anti-sigma regulatory factor (Ser/Thr protein kinase)